MFERTTDQATMILLFFSILFFVLNNAIDLKLRDTMILKDMTCTTTDDCLAKYTKGDWCKRGVVCSKSYCHMLYSYPCEYHEKCNSTTHHCDSMPCIKDKDCDDGKYCNGVERCDKVKHVCLPPTNPVQCISGECNETLKKCVFLPTMVAQWRDFKHSGEIKIGNYHDNHHSKPKPKVILIGHESEGFRGDNTFRVQDTSNSSSVTLNSTEVTIIICLVIFFVGVILMLLFFAVFTRAGVHETIYVA